MYSASPMLVMLYAINSVMDGEWSDWWIVWQYSVVTCLYHHWIKPLAYQVVKLWTTRGLIFDYFREICARSLFTRMESSSFFVFVFVFFFHKICEVFESLYSLSKHLGMQTYKSNKIPPEWLNNIVRGRLVYQMSAALESKKRNEKRCGP